MQAFPGKHTRLARHDLRRWRDPGKPADLSSGRRNCARSSTARMRTRLWPRQA